MFLAHSVHKTTPWGWHCYLPRYSREMTLEEAGSICPVIRFGLRRRQRTYVLCQSQALLTGVQAALWPGTLNTQQTPIHSRKEVPDLDRKCKETEEAEAASAAHGDILKSLLCAFQISQGERINSPNTTYLQIYHELQAPVRDLVEAHLIPTAGATASLGSLSAYSTCYSRIVGGANLLCLE